MELLKLELNEQVEYIELMDYPLPYPQHSKRLILNISIRVPTLLKAIAQEHKNFLKCAECEKFDRVISDGRYGIFKRGIPSFFITHQLRFIVPYRIKSLERGTVLFNAYFLKDFDKILIPDYSDCEDKDLSGDLSHNLTSFDGYKLVYFGIVSDFTKKDCNEDIDTFFSISGPEPSRRALENVFLDQINRLDRLDKRIVISLGNRGSHIKDEYKLKDNITVYSFLTKEKREELLNRSKLVISRSGYSTIMDLYALGKKALFIPTPQQTEQEYLAEYHRNKGTFSYVRENQFNLVENLRTAHRFKGPTTSHDIDKNIEVFLDNIYN
jgi:UDP-N-acetylglucosamine transferase subunit ALG13